MRTVFKYPIKITDVQTIKVKKESRPLHVGLDPQGVPCLWLEVNTESEDMPAEVYVVGTGRPMPEGAQCYIGSFNQGPFVWHIYL